MEAENVPHGEPQKTNTPPAEKKEIRRKRNEREQSQNNRKRTVQNFADPDDPARAVFVDGAIGLAVFIDAQPDQKRGLNSGRIKSDEVKRGDSVAQQFQQGSSGSQSGGPEMDWQQRAIQKPGGNRGRANQYAGVTRKECSEDG